MDIKEYPRIPAVVGEHDTADGLHLILAIGSLASTIDVSGSVAYFQTQGLIDFVIEADAYVGREQRRIDDENYLDAFLADLLALIEADKWEDSELDDAEDFEREAEALYEELIYDAEDYESDLEELYDSLYVADAKDYVETDTEDFPE